MKQGDPESVKDFKRSGDLLKWTQNNGAMNRSVAKVNSIVDSVINDQLLSCYNKERLVLVILSKRVIFYLSNLSSGERSE